MRLVPVAAVLAVLAVAPGPARAQTVSPPAARFASDVLPEPAETPDATRGGEPGLATEWVGPPQWLTGFNIGGTALNGSIDRGRNFILVNSTVTEAGDVPVEIRFDSTETTLAGRYTLGGQLAWAGTGVVRGSAYDVSDPAVPRRLNLLFTERGGTPNQNGVWQPDASTQGDIEILYVMASSYDGTGLTYANRPLSDPKPVLYGWFARVQPGRRFFETSPAALRIGFAYVTDFTAETAASSAPAVDLAWSYARPEGASFRVRRRPTATPDAAFATVATLGLGARSYRDGPLAASDRFTYRVEALGASGAVVHTSGDASATASRSRNAELVGVYDGRAGYADVWGYVAPDGREYALGALQSQGLVVVDVTAVPPVEVGFVPVAPGSSDSKEVETYGQYAYVVNEVGPVQIVSLADPSNPVVVGSLNTQPGVSNGGSHTHAVVGDRLYVNGGRAPGGVRVYSLADPVAPAFLGRYEPFYVHDVGVSGTTMYAAAIYGQGIDVVDVSNPAAMTRRALVNYPGSGAHNVCLTSDGRTAFVGDEIGGAGNWTRIFDVSDPDDAELVGEVVVDGAAVVHNCYVRGDRLFLAHYTEGLRVFDISTPHAPVEVAFYDTYAPAGYGYNGAWAAYPYLPSGNVLVSDRTGGIAVVRLTGVVAAEPAAPGTAEVTVGPNPVRGTARGRFALGAPAEVRVSVSDVLGREVAVLASGARAAGDHVAALDGRSLAPGVYVVRVSVAGAAERSALVTVVR